MSLETRVFEAINGEELANLALGLAGIFGPQGQEEPVGEAVYQWMVDHDIPAQKQLVAGTRFNVIGRMPGAGGGRSLAFNSHMDTVHIYKGEPQTGQHDMAGYRAWREEEKLFGLAILNCRGPLSTWLIAAKAIQEAGVRLKGDLVLTAVVGETGAAPDRGVPGPAVPGQGHRHADGHRLWPPRGLCHGGRDHRLRPLLGGVRRGLRARSTWPASRSTRRGRGPGPARR